MREYEKMFKNVINEIEVLAGYIEDNENVKEYLIESGEWEESYMSEFNIITLLENYFTNYYN